jgi:hypothetical protein
LHIPGDLEIWIRRQTVQPGATVPLVGRVKINSRAIEKQLAFTVKIAEDTTVQLSARVGRRRNLRILSTLSGVTSLSAGAAFWATESWLVGLLVAVFGMAVAAAIWRFSRNL